MEGWKEISLGLWQGPVHRIKTLLLREAEELAAKMLKNRRLARLEARWRRKANG